MASLVTLAAAVPARLTVSLLAAIVPVEPRQLSIRRFKAYLKGFAARVGRW